MKKIHWSSDCARTIEELKRNYQSEKQATAEELDKLRSHTNALRNQLHAYTVNYHDVLKENEQLKKQIDDLQKPVKAPKKKKRDEAERGTTDHA